MATATATRTITRYRNPKARHHHRAKLTIPLAVVAGFAPITIGAYSATKQSGAAGLAQHLAGNLGGYSIESGKWYPDAMIKGWTPILLGLGLHKLASALGVNRALSSARVPFIRI